MNALLDEEISHNKVKKLDELHPMQIEPEILNPLKEPDWDLWVMRHPDYSFFHGTAWARVLIDSYGFTPCYFAARSGSGLDALVPVMEANSLIAGKRGVSLPFSDFCQPLASNVGNMRGLSMKILQHGKNRDWKYFESRGGNTPEVGVRPSVSYFAYELDLTAGESKLFVGLDSSNRRAIRKAQREGLSVDICRSPDSIKSFYSLHCKTRRKHGLPPQPFNFFRNIYRHVFANGSGFVAIARYQQRSVAGAVFCHLGHKVIYKFGASDASYAHLRGNNLVMWEAIKWCAANGFSSFHFGRTSILNEGLRRFKRGWGGIESTINYFSTI